MNVTMQMKNSGLFEILADVKELGKVKFTDKYLEL
jgi:hypothetical protein